MSREVSSAIITKAQGQEHANKLSPENASSLEVTQREMSKVLRENRVAVPKDDRV